MQKFFTPARFVVILSIWAIFSVPAAERATGNSFDKVGKKILRFRFNKNDLIEIRKFSKQEVKLNNKPLTRYVHHRVLLDVKDKDYEKGYLLSGKFESKFRYEKQNRTPYRSEEYFTSEFYLEPRGTFHVPDDAYMPNVRNIPTFDVKRDPALKKKKALEKGDTWSAPGVEVMKFSRLVKVPLDVNYEYGGSQTVNTDKGVKTLHRIVVNYNIDYKLDKPEPNMPHKFFGYATAVYFWDEAEHMPYYTQEDYNIIMLFANGNSSEFTIKSKSVYRKIERLASKDKGKLKDDLNDKLKLAFKDEKKKAPEVKETKEGLTITLPDILFEFNSSELTSRSQELLEGVTSVLEQYPNLRIQVRGHTDNVGKKSYNQQLSEARAKSVVSYILDESKLKAERFSYKGYGSNQPIASNKTEKGRKKNRRVEFLILE